MNLGEEECHPCCGGGGGGGEGGGEGVGERERGEEERGERGWGEGVGERGRTHSCATTQHEFEFITPKGS